MQGLFKRSRNFGKTHNLGSEIMANLYNNIESLCTKRGINVTTMCRESGASRGSLTDLKSGRKQTLKYETLEKIANYFEISVESLVSGDGRKKEKPSGLPAGLDAAQYTPEQLEVLNAVTEKIQTEEGCQDMYNLLKAMHIL